MHDSGAAETRVRVDEVAYLEPLQVCYAVFQILSEDLGCVAVYRGGRYV